MHKFFTIIIFTFLLSSSFAVKAYERVVVVGGDLTEVIYALERNEKIVGVDITSYFPPQVNKIPKVGYKRTLSSEGILSLKPDLIITSGFVGPQAVIEQIKSTNIKVEMLNFEESFEGITNKVNKIGELFNANLEAKELNSSLKETYKKLEERKISQKNKKKGLFLLSHAGGGKGMVAGRNTSADFLFKMAGLENSAAKFEGHKPVNPESFIDFNPDFVVLSKIPGASEEKLLERILSMPGFNKTNAGKSNNIHFVDAVEYTGFGPRNVNAALLLNGKIYKGKGE